MFTKEFEDYYRTGVTEARARREWGRYVHDVVFKKIKSFVPQDTRVLAIGPWVSIFLPLLKPSEGIGIDPFLEVTQAQSSSRIRFSSSPQDLSKVEGKFDYVILYFAIGEMEDILESLLDLRRFCDTQTRLIITYYSRLWQPAIKLAEWLGFKQEAPEVNWAPPSEIENLMFLSGFQVIKDFMCCLVPFKLPVVSTFVNKYIANLPFFNEFGLTTMLVGRALRVEQAKLDAKENPPKVSIVIPARNEEGNIHSIVKRIPDFPGGTEIIFVEGGSSDGTRAAIQSVIEANAQKDIKFFTQNGKGKKDAVRKGFSVATGDILAILDADITVPPESLPRFVDTIVKGKAEFVNGSRMVYPMRGKAMRVFNLLGNVFFSKCFSYLLDQPVRDTLCGTKVLRRSDYMRIVKNSSYFGEWDPFGDFDLLFGATYLNLKIVDLPIRYTERVYGTTNINRWRDGLTLLKMTVVGLFKLKFNWLSL